MSVKLWVPTVLFLIFLLSLRLFLFYREDKPLLNGQELNFKVRLTEEPQVINGRQQFRIQTPEGDRIRITTGLSPQVEYGDILRISGEVKSSEYKGHTFFTMLFPQVQIAKNDQNIISLAANQVRRKASDLFKKSLTPVSARLLSGIVFGGDQGMPKKFMEDLRISGVVHVIAASGMNVTFVAGALIGMLGALVRRQIALTIAILGVVFYAFLAGFEPSIVRASVMSILAFTASLLGRQNYALIALFITGYIMLLFTPLLIFDLGFQLSFLATLGIILIKPGLPLGRNKFVLDDIGTTISAQLATLPILLAVFGQYGLLSVIVNALVLWTVPMLMIIGSIGLVFGLVFEPLGKLILLLAAPILFFFEKTVSFFGSLSWTVTIPSVSPAVWIGYYLILGAILISLKMRKKNEKSQKLKD